MNPSTLSASPQVGRRIWILAGLLVSGGGAWAQNSPLPPQPTTPLETKAVETKAAPTPRVFDVAPTFSFATLNGQTWNSRDFLGNRALMVLLLPDKKSERFATAFAGAAEKLRAAGIEPVMLFSRDAQGVQKQVAPALLQTLVVGSEVEAVRTQFGINSHDATLLFIDRAGFWRRTDVFPSIEGFSNTLEQVSAWSPKIEVGQVAPDFSMPTSGGKVLRLSDLRGQKNVLLTFFPKCFTGGCTNHLTSLRDAQPQFDDAQTQVVAVSVDAADGPRGQIAFAARWNLGFPLVPDVGRNLCLLFGAATSPNQLATRMSVLVDKKGVVRWISQTVDVHTHGTDVVEVLKQQGLSK